MRFQKKIEKRAAIPCPQCAQTDEPVHAGAFHRLDHVSCAGSPDRTFAARTKRDQRHIVTRDRIDNRMAVENVAGVAGEISMRHGQCLWPAGKGGYLMALGKRLFNQVAAESSCGAKDNQFHFKPPVA